MKCFVRRRDVAHAGFTVVEVLTVLLVLIGVAAIAFGALSNTMADARVQTTQATLAELQRVVAGRYLLDVRAVPRHVRELLVRPVDVPEYDMTTRIGWRGPYVLTITGRHPPRDDLHESFVAEYGTEGELAVLDGWQRPIVVHVPDADANGAIEVNEALHMRFVSAGEDGVLQTPRGELLPSLTACGDDVVVYVRVPDTRRD